MKKEHILVIRFSALGDVAMAVPVVWALATQYPDIRVTVLSKSFARTLFEDLAPNVNFMEADLNTEYHGVKGLNALYRRLVAKQFTKIADLHKMVNYLLSQLEQRWIPVTEKLPEDEKKNYWVCTDTGYQCECRWTNINHIWTDLTTNWHWHIMDIPQYSAVIAWRELPEPWKEGETE